MSLTGSAMDHPNRVGVTAPPGDSSSRLATTAFIQTAIAGINIGSLVPSGIRAPGTGAYALVESDFLSTITSGSAGGVLTITVPNTISPGFMFWAFRNTNDIVVQVSGGNIAWPDGNFTSNFTISKQFKLVGFVFDSANLYVISGQIPQTKIQVFNASGTYTPTVGMQTAIIEAVGGGGAGGGVVGAASRFVGGGGGGAGSWSKASVTAAQIGASQVVTIGPGGTGSSGAAGGNGTDTSVGSLCIGKGGTGGGFNNASTNFGAPGAGGVAGTGDHTTVGNPGGQGETTALASITAGSLSGYGGQSLFGGAAAATLNGGGTSAGNAAAANSGSGGSGATSGNTASNAAGGNGGSGKVVITEYIFT